jgi:hypothetical protein
MVILSLAIRTLAVHATVQVSNNAPERIKLTLELETVPTGYDLISSDFFPRGRPASGENQ